VTLRTRWLTIGVRGPLRAIDATGLSSGTYHSIRLQWKGPSAGGVDGSLAAIFRRNLVSLRAATRTRVLHVGDTSLIERGTGPMCLRSLESIEKIGVPLGKIRCCTA
jgi:hypothetical protein